MTDWETYDLKTIHQARVDYLRPRNHQGEGAHLVHTDTATLLVLPDTVTTHKRRGNAILVGLADNLAGALEELRRIGACRWTLTTTAGVEDFRLGRQQLKLLDLLVKHNGMWGHDLARLVGHRFGGRVKELRDMGYPVASTRMTNNQWWYSLASESNMVYH